MAWRTTRINNGSLAEVTTATLVVTLNRLERDARTVLWLSWVEYRQQDEIARRTGFPLERVEWLLDRTLQQVREACGMGDLRPQDTINDDDIHKWLEGGESERGE